MKSFSVGLAMLELVMVMLTIRAGVSQPSNQRAAVPAPDWGSAAACPALTGQQAAGVAVSGDRRVFASFPARSPAADGALAEITGDGSVLPYPNLEWNAWGLKASLDPTEHFVCVQSLTCDGEGGLWALDSGVLKGAAVDGAAKLVRIDLATNRVDRVYAFRRDVAWQGSRFSGVRIDEARKTAYITDAGAGGLVVLNLATGRAHRLPGDRPAISAATELRPGLGLRSAGR